MNKMKNLRLFLVAGLVLFLCLPATLFARTGWSKAENPGFSADFTPVLLAAAGDEQEMLGLFYGETELVTRTKQPLHQVSGLVTVIENNEMRRRGARDLTDVLRLVPGIEVVFDFNAYPVVVMRGYRSNASEKILFMINDHPVNSDWTGGATMFFAEPDRRCMVRARCWG